VDAKLQRKRALHHNSGGGILPGLKPKGRFAMPQQGQPPPGKQINVNVDSPALLKKWAPVDSKALIQGIEAKRDGSRVLCIAYHDIAPTAPALAPAMIAPLERVLRNLGKVPRLDVFLRSTGGFAEVPWRIVSLLREFSDQLGVIVGSIAYSGASHVAISADELLMTPFSVLGSVDPTRNHPLLPKDTTTGQPIPASVQDLKHCMLFIKEQLGKDREYSSSDLATIITELFRHVEPMAIGAIEQSYSLSRLITRKVLSTRKKKLDDTLVKRIEDQLAGQYFSHAFPISRADVEADLGLPVIKIDGDFFGAILKLEDHYKSEFSRRIPITGSGPEPAFGVGAFIETSFCRFALGQIINQNQVIIDPWLEITN
jgi:hypothetical protein